MYFVHLVFVEILMITLINSLTENWSLVKKRKKKREKIEGKILGKSLGHTWGKIQKKINQWNPTFIDNVYVFFFRWVAIGGSWN